MHWLPSQYICHWCLVNLNVLTPVIVYANSEQAGHVLVEVDVDVYADIYFVLLLSLTREQNLTLKGRWLIVKYKSIADQG